MIAPWNSAKPSVTPWLNKNEHMKNYIILLISVLFIASCNNRDLEKGEKSITAADMSEIVKNLASDDFMGRKPFTPGEKITIDYLAGQLKKIGFEPAFNGSYFQPVPMVELSSEVNGPAIIKTATKSFSFNAPEDIAITSPQISDEVFINGSEMVFAGFGIVAPEFNRNDYNGLDVKGKTVVVMINDPGLYLGDTTYFKGREMTYYGRWTYKFEEAARQGASGILIIHETEGAGYQYTIPRKSSITPRLYMQTADSNRTLCKFTGWLSAGSADTLFNKLGYNVTELRMASCKKEFKGFDLNAKISLSISNKFTFNTSTNVAGVLKGTTRADECIIYTGHWDHFGIGEKENGDSIYNGAVDNGTTMAWALEIGEAFSGLKNRQERSVVIMFPTAEEQGLLGSAYYTEHPAFAMEKTVACFNNDMMLPVGRMRDLMITGYGQSSLDELLAEGAERQDRYIIRDPNSQTGMYFRSDHFPFAKKGVPSAFARGNVESREHGKEWAANKEIDYINNKYHRPADNYESETWDLNGIVEDARLAFYVGYKLSNSDDFPTWKQSSEFKNIRK
jgi:Zn-dependent M28 family amino/carboxypeptidase